VLFVMFIIQAPAGDRRNWPAIRAWAAGIPAAFAMDVAGEPQVSEKVFSSAAD
jgi:hypothetical protein